MNRREFVQWKKGIYLAQLLEGFETIIETRLSTDDAGAIQDFKGMVRSRLKALAADSVEIYELTDSEVNGVAQTIRHELSPTGRP